MPEEPSAPDHHSTPAESTPDRSRAVVAIGGSAGALDGYERFFLNLPPGTGMAFVVVPHLDPRQRGLMPEILQRCTPLPVLRAEDGQALKPDHVYVLPPGRSMSVMNGTLLLDDLQEASGLVIDHFFASLAADQGEHAVGIILSGMGSDGTRGVQAIKEHFGLVLVQSPDSAEYPSMPRSAVNTQLASDVLSAEDLAPRLVELVTRTRARQPDEGLGGGQGGVALQKILRLVRVRTGHDFTRYKRSTLVRRIDRRMKGYRMNDVAQYVRMLQDNPEEVEALFQDFTINVTSFFRDVDAFDALKDHMREYIMAHKQDLDAFRIWIAGCSTGEEAYSVAIVLMELLDELKDHRTLKVQIFATDIDGEAVNKARYGLYPQDIAYVVTPERLERFFTPKDGGYQVRAEVRDLLVFAVHNTFGDPPFTRLDLLCCRNMLIYLGSDLQQHIMALFYYALRPQALLFLGASETIGTERDRFLPLNGRWKIFQRGPGSPGPLPVGHAPGMSALAPNQDVIGSPARITRPPDLSHQTQSMLLAEFAPPAVVVNESGEILFVNGRTARYLEFPSGKTLANVFDMARDTLRYELPAALRQASQERHEVRRADLSVEIEGARRRVDLIVRPMPGTLPGLLLVIFDEHEDASDEPSTPEKTDRVLLLERELQHSRESLQATIEEMAVSMEELKSTNEELQTTNEELQSSNEELTTSKEELQSLNEELITINAEHQRAIQDHAQANDDMRNLLDSAGIATLFLGNDLRVKRFTPRITRVINLAAVDVGRPVTDISVNLRYEQLSRDITRVLETLEAFEAQVQTHDGQWYLMRISPYRTSDNFIDGVVVAFTNIDLIRGLEQRLQEALSSAEAVLNSLPDPVLVLDRLLRVVSANQALYDLLRTTESQVQGAYLYDIGHFVLDQPELLHALRDVANTDRGLDDFILDVTLPGVGARKLKVAAQPVGSEDTQRALLLLRLEDVTELLERAEREGADLSGPASAPDPAP